MERAKLKFTVIILLVVLNVILLALVMTQRSQTLVYEEAGRSQALQYLEHHGITVEEDIIPWESTLQSPKEDAQTAQLVSELAATDTWEIQSMRQPETLLVDFVTGLSDLGVTCSRIEHISEGYTHVTEGDRTVFTPVWAIITDNGSYRLDCAAGTLKKY